MERKVTPLKSHDAVMVCISLDETIIDIRKAKKTANKLGNMVDDRYYHGYEEGLKRALRIVKGRFGAA